MSLRRKLARFGFESNDDYDYALRCVLNAAAGTLRCLNVTGDSGRRKTAFANALGHALEYSKILYYDFSRREEPPAQVSHDPADDHGAPAEAPLSTFERTVVEACAWSEAEHTLLILDQLHRADFQEHIRLYHFVQTREWTTVQGTVAGNPRKLLLALISEEALYHSLQKVSFRVWTDPSASSFEFSPSDFGLDARAAEMFAALGALFEQIGRAPTHSEFSLLLGDIDQLIRTPEQLRQSLFGRTEHIDRAALYAREIEPALKDAVEAINRYVGLDEIQLGG